MDIRRRLWSVRPRTHWFAIMNLVARSEYLDRLGALPSTQQLTPGFWDEVHEEFQAGLVPLESEIRHRLPMVQMNAGRTSGREFLLFTYRTFSMPELGLDPVVVGLTFATAGQTVTVEVDVSGEQLGDRISSAHRKTVASSREELLATVRETARNLHQSAGAIAFALTDQTRKVD
jgi:hypothetical protein